MKTLSIWACLAVVVGTGAAHGLFTNRWQPAVDFTAVQKRLNAVPQNLEPWKSRDVVRSDDELNRVSIRAHLSRDYQDGLSGRSVQILVVAGSPGPISVHTPDVCFSGTGYEQSSPAEQIAVGDKGARLWAATFTKPGPVPSRLRVFWGWNGGAGWEAPDHRKARFQFAFRPVLYKVYLVTDDSMASASGQPNPAEVLAGRLLPEIDEAISGTPGAN